jgi:mono/diheme cytochrome c family protein
MKIERCESGSRRRGLAACAILSALAVCILGANASAQTSDQTAPSTARKDFVLHCADCHGVDGKGNGPAVQVIPGFKPVDLTTLTKNHDGKFPRDFVYEVIDGRKQLPGHYDPDTDMPLWGLTFQTEGREFSKQSEEKVKARIDALVEYIEGIQTK